MSFALPAPNVARPTTTCRGGHASRVPQLSRGGSRFGGDTRALTWRPSVAVKPSVSRDVKAMGGKVDPKDEWWLKNTAPNMRDVTSHAELLEQLQRAGDKLVVVDFYAKWCGACRTLYPKLCQIATKEEDVIFLKVEFDENKDLCRTLGVKILPYFQFYKGKEGKVTEFSASLNKVARLRDNLAKFSNAGAAK